MRRYSTFSSPWTAMGASSSYSSSTCAVRVIRDWVPSLRELIRFMEMSSTSPSTVTASAGITPCMLIRSSKGIFPSTTTRLLPSSMVW